MKHRPDKTSQYPSTFSVGLTCFTCETKAKKSTCRPRAHPSNMKKRLDKTSEDIHPLFHPEGLVLELPDTIPLREKEDEEEPEETRSAISLELM